MEERLAAERVGLERVMTLVRKASAQGRLVTLREAAGVFLPDAPPDEASPRLVELLSSDGDLRLIGEGEQACLYAEGAMTSAYARLAFLAMASDAAGMIAETVREESRCSQRPIPADVFTEAPFELAPDQIAAALARLTEDPAFADIGQVTTSDQQVYLYSSKHLPPELAASLAEWYAVGQFASP